MGLGGHLDSRGLRGQKQQTAAPNGFSLFVIRLLLAEHVASYASEGVGGCGGVVKGQKPKQKSRDILEVIKTKRQQEKGKRGKTAPDWKNITSGKVFSRRSSGWGRRNKRGATTEQQAEDI